jgi:hypothetical protein
LGGVLNQDPVGIADNFSGGDSLLATSYFARNQKF